MNEIEKTSAFFQPLFLVILFFAIGKIINFSSGNASHIVHVSTDWIVAICLNLCAIWITIRFFSKSCIPISKFNDFKIYLLTSSTIWGTLIMYLAHDIFKLSTLNNDICSSMWNIVTLFWGFTVLTLYEYYKSSKGDKCCR